MRKNYLKSILVLLLLASFFEFWSCTKTLGLNTPLTVEKENKISIDVGAVPTAIVGELKQTVIYSISASAEAGTPKLSYTVVGFEDIADVEVSNTQVKITFKKAGTFSLTFWANVPETKAKVDVNGDGVDDNVTYKQGATFVTRELTSIPPPPLNVIRDNNLTFNGFPDKVEADIVDLVLYGAKSNFNYSLSLGSSRGTANLTYTLEDPDQVAIVTLTGTDLEVALNNKAGGLATLTLIANVDDVIEMGKEDVNRDGTPDTITYQAIEKKVVIPIAVVDKYTLAEKQQIEVDDALALSPGEDTDVEAKLALELVGWVLGGGYANYAIPGVLFSEVFGYVNAGLYLDQAPNPYDPGVHNTDADSVISLRRRESDGTTTVLLTPQQVTKMVQVYNYFLTGKKQTGALPTGTAATYDQAHFGPFFIGVMARMVRLNLPFNEALAATIRQRLPTQFAFK